MKRTISLLEIINDGSLSVIFNDKRFGATSLQDLLTYSETELNEMSGVLLRSLLFIEYMKNNNLPISATLDTEEPNGNWVKLNA